MLWFVAFNSILAVALHVTKRPNGANAKTRGRVTGSINGNVTSQEARGGEAVGLEAPVASPSSPGCIGKASNKRAGQPRSEDANARTAVKAEISISLRRSLSFRGLIGQMLVLMALLISSYNENGCVMRLIPEFRAAEQCVISANISFEVALHVTKRQNGANAKTRGRVTGSINGNVTSQEARGGEAVG